MCIAQQETDLQLPKSFMCTQSLPLTSLSATFIWPTSSLATFMFSLEMFSLSADCICQRIQGDIGKRDPNTFTPVPIELLGCCFGHYFPLALDSCAVCCRETLQRFGSDISPPSLCYHVCLAPFPGFDTLAFFYYYYLKIRMSSLHLGCFV